MQTFADNAPLRPLSPVFGAIGAWLPDAAEPTQPYVGESAWIDAIQSLNRPVFVVDCDGTPGVATTGSAMLAADRPVDPYSRWGDANARTLLGYASSLPASRLGSDEFRASHCLQYAYIAGEMANGIGSAEIVEAMSRAGMLGFFGAAGLEPGQVEAAIERIQRNLGERPYGFNLIHSPAEPALEAEIVDLYLRRGVRLVSASAYLGLTLPLVRYRVSGIHVNREGRIVAPNRVMAKVSRVEVATQFLSPPPASMLRELVQLGQIAETEARLSEAIPMAEDLTAEADSGGHTDNRPLVTLLPTLMALRDAQQAQFGYETLPRVGAAGGLATPESVAAAFAMGAAYVMTGSINQACVEAGTSATVKRMLADATQADVIMAPAADMFEMGVRVQVLKRGTLFAMRARKLYDLYRAYDRLDDLPDTERAALERDIFRTSLDEAWQATSAYFAERDPGQIERGERDPKHKMALVFRAYLGQSSNWANRGDPGRKLDYQIWCGPAMGAFNEWARGSCLEPAENRDVVTVGLNLMFGAAALTRAALLRTQGVSVPRAAECWTPRRFRVAGNA